MRRGVSILGVVVLGVAVLVSAGGSAGAQTPSCDMMTGGGFIVRPSGAQANFGVAGGCKKGSPTFGHLEYIDHGVGLNVHWTSITAYVFVDMGTPNPRTGQPTGTRRICGTARTNDPAHPDVNFVVTAKDAGEPGTNDEFTIQLTIPVSGGQSIVYTTASDTNHKLGGGNIQLHNPNPSTAGSFGGSCPAFDQVITG